MSSSSFIVAALEGRQCGGPAVLSRWPGGRSASMMRQARRTVDGRRRRGMASTTCRRVGWFDGDGSLVKDGGEESQIARLRFGTSCRRRAAGVRSEHGRNSTSHLVPARCGPALGALGSVFSPARNASPPMEVRSGCPPAGGQPRASGRPGVPGQQRQPAAPTLPRFHTPTGPGTSQPTSVPLTMKWKGAGPVCLDIRLHLQGPEVPRYLTLTSLTSVHTLFSDRRHDQRPASPCQALYHLFLPQSPRVPLRIAERRVPDAVPPTLPRTARRPWGAGIDDAHMALLLNDRSPRPSSASPRSKTRGKKVGSWSLLDPRRVWTLEA